MNRRGFLGAMLLAGAAPAIVRADALMKIVPRDVMYDALPLLCTRVTVDLGMRFATVSLFALRTDAVFEYRIPITQIADGILRVGDVIQARPDRIWRVGK